MSKATILLAALAVALSVSAGANASSVIPLDLDKMSRKAGKIFYGKCIDVQAITDEKGIPAALVTYRVLRSVKGADSDEVTFKVFRGEGISGDGRPVVMRGSREFYPGNEDVLFLYNDSAWGFSSPVGLWQGDFPVVQTEHGPRLLNSSRSYKNAIGTTRTKSSTTPNTAPAIATPDDLLDEVEEILEKE